MVCPKCGNILPDHAKYCLECGEKIASLEEKKIPEVAQRISSARKLAGLDLTQASKLLSISEAELVALENGEAEPAIQQISAICTGFKVSTDYLLLGTNSDGSSIEKYSLIPKDKENLSSETYTIVLSTDQSHLYLTSMGIRSFFQDRNFYKKCVLVDGRKGNQVSDDVLQKIIDVLSKNISNSPIILCKGLSHGVALKTVDLFQDRANIFVFNDEDGTSLKQLQQASPFFQHMMTDPPFKYEEEEDFEDISNFENKLVCPVCGSTNCTPIVETHSSGKMYSVGEGCCGYVLFGPFGLLCGLCGENKQIGSATYWMCSDCGNKFQK